jgi:deazaflavin-dependent oxidoreductase (nitroreductase family)
MKLSRRVAHFNRVINNRIQGVYAWLVPPWAVILHRGRRSGRSYRTPVLAFRQDRTLVIALLYGEESDWLRNLRAARGGQVVRMGRTFELREPRVVDASTAPELSRLSPLARAYCRLADNQVLAEIGERLGGFGPGRATPAGRAERPDEVDQPSAG